MIEFNNISELQYFQNKYFLCTNSEELTHLHPMCTTNDKCFDAECKIFPHLVRYLLVLKLQLL